MPIGYYYEENTTELEKAAKAGLQAYDAAGVLQSDGAGTITGIAIDNVPTEGSNNLVKSGGIFSAIKTVSDNAAPIIEDSASGAIASFPDGADSIPVKSLISYINPVQDLHGQSFPYPAGGYKNKLGRLLSDVKSGNTSGTWTGNTYVWNGVTFVCEEQDGYITSVKASGTASANAYLMVAANIAWDSGNNYIGNGCPEGGESNNKYGLGFRYANETHWDIGSGTAITGASSLAEVIIMIRNGYAISGSLTFKPMIRLSTEADATFAPYSNICPITGFTEANIGVSSPNILSDVSAQNQTTQYGNVIVGSYKIVKGKKYALSFDTINSGISVYRQSPTVTGIDFEPYSFTCNGTRRTFIGYARETATHTNETLIARQTATSGTGSGLCTNIQLEVIEDDATTGTPYSPYVGNTIYNVSWQDEAGTVYSGTLEYLGNSTWKLTSIYKDVNLGGYSWTYTSGNNPIFYSPAISDYNYIDNDTINALCEIYRVISVNQRYIDKSLFINSAKQIVVSDSAYTDATTFKNAMSGVQLVYELATPIEYTLSGPDPETLFGQNNIFNDTNGNIEVEYIADTKLFILKAIANA